MHITAENGIVLVAAGSAPTNFFILDATDGPPEIVGAITLPGFPTHAARSGDHAWVTAQAEGVHLLNIADPANPVLLRTLETSGSAARSTISSNVLYVADGSGVAPFDISDPANPAQGQRVSLGGAFDVAVRGSIGYATSGTGARLALLDLSRPLAPAFIRNITLGPSGGADDIEISGDLAYVTLREGGLAVLDLTVPDSPTVLNTFGGPLNPVSVQVREPYVFVTKRGGGGGVTVYDLGDPRVPRIAAQLHSTDILGSGPTGLALDGDRLHFTLNNSFSTWRSVRWDPSTLPMLGELLFPNILMPSLQVGVSNILVGAPRLLEINADDPASPFIVRTNVDAFLNPFVLAENFGAGLIGESFQVYQRLPDDTLTPRGSVQLPFAALQPSRLAVKDHYVYLAHSSLGLQIFDVLDLDTPRLLPTSTRWRDGREITIDDELGAIISGSAPQLLDLTDPAEPQDAGRIADLSAFAHSLALRDQRLYVGVRVGSVQLQQHELRIYDVNNSASPVLLGTAPLRSRPDRLALHRSLVFIAEGQNGFEVFDATDPAAPSRVGGSGVITTDFAFREPHFYTIGSSFAVHETPQAGAYQLGLPSLDPTTGELVIRINAPPGLLEILSSADLVEWSSFATLQSATGSYELRIPPQQERLFFRAMTR